MDKICRCYRTNVGSAEEPVYVLSAEDGSTPSGTIAPEDPPVLGDDGLPELWYWADAPTP